MDQSIQQAFFSARNRSMIINVMEKNIQSRRKSPLSDNQRKRISSIIDHYMKEVFDVQGNKPLAFLNKETLIVSEKQYYHSKHFPAAATTAGAAGAGAPKKVSFASVVAGTSQGDLPTIPDFRAIFDEYPMNTNSLFDKEKEKRAAAAAAATAMSTKLDDLLDNSVQNDIVNMLMPGNTGSQQPQLQQNILIKDEAVQSYREVESNLILYSADRDWAMNGSENRYKFSVNFDPASVRGKFGKSPASIRKFNNIVRIELVKAILPAESIDTLIYKDVDNGTLSNIETNILTYPQIVVRVEEFSANNYGTDEILDNAFGVLQYDANWKSDTSSQGQGKGYLAMIPKFLKCQRIFQPTPLSTLQKLTVRLERPDGTLIDDHMDTFNIADIIEGTALPNPGSHYYSSSGGPSEFIALKMSKFFSHFAAQRGDRVIFQNFTVIPNTTGLSASDEASILSAADDLMRFINREEGHLVCDVGYDSGSGYVSEGWNSVGYSNYIVIRSKYADPETGSTAPDPFGGSVIMSELMFDKVKGTVSDGVGMNMMRQTQLVFRIITRELDSTTHIRPDNK